MKSFLFEIAEAVNRDHSRKLESLTLVFPNRRAALYFRKHLGSLLDKPVFAPNLLTIEDFISNLSSLRVPDKLELIHHLYSVYFNGSDKDSPHETFDQFYFWGEMLLKDFEEIDKYMVNADHLFKDLSNQKELDATFEFLTQEHQEFLKTFWISFQERPSINKERFLNVWRRLNSIYKGFKELLFSKGLAYDGMQHRDVAEKIKSANLPGDVRFVGFNALTKAEEVIMAACVEHGGAKVDWDMDTYYVNNVTQEAGRFFREYQDHAVFKDTFPDEIASNFLEKTKIIKLFGAAQPIGQVKLASQILDEVLRSGLNPEETLVVLPDEKLLMPVLHGVSGAVEKLNVTMGFPLSATPMFNLIELLVELQITRKEDQFNHRAVLAILGHPYVVVADTAESNAKQKQIVNENRVHVAKGFLASAVQLHRLIFREVGDERTGDKPLDLLSYLREVITGIGTLKALPDFDKEYTLKFLTIVNRLDEVLGEPSKENESISARRNSWRSFLRLFRQVVRAQRIPFSGEPLRGLQVMGVLETRNLDFKNVFLLSLNEGAFPSFGTKGSYIPYNIRKAYRLPTVEHQDAMYAYLFYRMLQRAENIFLFYNSETDVLGQGEMSRYLQQLIYESGLKVERSVMNHDVQPLPVTPITILKDKNILSRLAALADEGRRHKGISPSALNAYIECRLRFYFRYIAKIYEPKEVEDDLDARVLGNFLHQVMERFYKQLREQKNSKKVEKDDFIGYEKKVYGVIDDVFRDSYKLDPGKPVEYEGQRLVVKEVIIRFVRRIMDIDKERAPFVLEAVEQEGMHYHVDIQHEPRKALLGGIIDRADHKDDELRVIDYKTGRDELDFISIESLFDRNGKRNKAAFQTLVYALLVRKNLKVPHSRLIPGLMNRRNLFDPNFTFGLTMDKRLVDNVIPLLDEFEARLKILLDDLYDPAQPFDQTKNEENCKFCPYKTICYR